MYFMATRKKVCLKCLSELATVVSKLTHQRNNELTEEQTQQLTECPSQAKSLHMKI